MQTCTANDDDALYQGDTWIFPFSLLNPVASDGSQTALDLTGFSTTATLLVGPQSFPVSTDPQSATNLLSAGQFRIVVPASLTSTIPADAPGAFNRAVRLRVVLTDPAGHTETIAVLKIRVLAA